MGKIAFLFSGQGDQFPGMGKELADKYEAAKAVFEACDAIRPGTSDMCFAGSEDDLKQTKNTQPCLFAMELAAAAVLCEKGIKADAVAGFSLGEVVAATSAGIFDNKTGFELVVKRGELMQTASEKFDTAMAAVVKLTNEQVEEAAKKYSQVYPVNYNCPGQVTVAGLASEMEPFGADIKELGGRAIPLKVSGAFHSPFMKEASEAFAEDIAKATTGSANTVLYSNMTAAPYTEDVVELLSKQICNPVRWEKIIRAMIADGVDTFIEIGPGKTLTNMMKKIDADVKAVSVFECLAEVEGC